MESKSESETESNEWHAATSLSNCTENYGQKQKIVKAVTVTCSTTILWTRSKLYFEWSSRCSSLFHFFVLGCVIAFQSVHTQPVGIHPSNINISSTFSTHTVNTNTLCKRDVVFIGKKAKVMLTYHASEQRRWAIEWTAVQSLLSLSFHQWHENDMIFGVLKRAYMLLVRASRPVLHTTAIITIGNDSLHHIIMRNEQQFD